MLCVMEKAEQKGTVLLKLIILVLFFCVILFLNLMNTRIYLVTLLFLLALDIITRERFKY